MMLPAFPRRILLHARPAVWSAVEQGLNPLLQLALTPLLLSSLGREAFALWVLGITLIGLSQLVSAGAGFATIKHVSEDLGAARPAEAVLAVRAGLGLAVTGGGVAILLAGILGSIVGAHGIGALAPQPALAGILVLCGPAVLLNEFDNVLASAMRGAQRFDLAARAETARLAMVAVIALLAARGVTVAGLFAAWVAMMLLKAVIKAVCVARLFGRNEACRPSFARQPLVRLLRFGGWQWLQSTGTLVFTTADPLLVGALLGAGALTRYSVCLQLAQYVHFAPSVMLQVIFPRISARGAGLDARQGNRILNEATLAGVGLALLIGVVIALLAEPLLRLWVGADFAAMNAGLLRLLVAVHVVLAINIGGYYVLLATGRAARSALVVLTAGIAQVIAILLAAPAGLLAVAASRFTYSIITASLYRVARYGTGR